MKKQLIQIAAVASIGLSGFATPAMAQDHYGQGGYYQGSGYDHAYQDNDNGYYDRGGNWRSNDGRDYRRDYRRNYRDCRQSSGTTGTIIGAIAGGLLGREIGRGGRYNRPSGTGTIIGAGAGALAGRAIDKSGSCR
jgi:outer membrane lipoprotein SlyB